MLGRCRRGRGNTVQIRLPGKLTLAKRILSAISRAHRSWLQGCWTCHWAPWRDAFTHSTLGVGPVKPWSKCVWVWIVSGWIDVNLLECESYCELLVVWIDVNCLLRVNWYDLSYCVWNVLYYSMCEMLSVYQNLWAVAKTTIPSLVTKKRSGKSIFFSTNRTLVPRISMLKRWDPCVKLSRATTMHEN